MSVKVMRIKLGRPYFNPKYVAWLPEHDALLGKLPDREVARRSGHNFLATRKRRLDRGLRDPSVRPDWSPAEDRLLGTAPDAEIALRVHRTLSGVKSRRKDLGIPAWPRR
jgi:hypothetical protein